MEHRASASGNEQAAQLSRNSNLLFIGFFLHLAVPTFLLGDIVTAGLRGEIFASNGQDLALKPVFPNTVVAAMSALWLITGLGFFFLQDREAFLTKVFRPLLTIYSIYLVVLIAEGACRLMGLSSPTPTPFFPLTKSVRKTDPASTPGVSGTKVLTINSLGLRGPMPPPHSTYRIVAIGGSTTICANLDDSEEWPHVLMVSMNASQNTLPVWVGNAGGNGRQTINHAVLMQWLPGLLHFDMVIFLVGVNDLETTLVFEGASTQAFLENAAGFQGNLLSGARRRSLHPLYRRLALFSLIQLTKERTKRMFGHWETRGTSSDFDAANLAANRRKRAAGPTVPLSDLSTGLAEYRGRILTLANQCRALQVRCLFLTQPTMWRNDLTSDEERLFWTGYTGRAGNEKGWVSSADLARGMDMYNYALLDACRQSGMECFDLASQIPKDVSVFWDEDHFNEAGARLVAQKLQRYLLMHPPFSHDKPPSVR
jgi:hypothetical protein